MRNLNKVIEALYNSNCFNPSGIAQLLEFIGQQDLGIEILMGDYQQPNLFSTVSDEKGILWELLSYNPLSDEITAKSGHSLVYAKDYDFFLAGKYQAYPTKGDYGFYLVSVVTRTFSKVIWDKMEPFDYSFHCARSLEEIYTPAQEAYLREKGICWEVTFHPDR